ncbi:AraC family transcriptional regulator [Georgfuchsia toluolica]|nr:AraC family transcriptional regulator [Georgfuchsia toluolica]
MLSGLARTRRSPDKILQDVGIAKSLLRDPTVRIALPRYAALYRRISESLQDEGFALFSHSLRPGSFEFLCRAVISATDLNEALQRAARFLGVLLDDLQIEIRTEDNSALLVIRQTRPLPVSEGGRVFAFEWLLRLLHGLCAWLIARPLAIDSVAFPYPRPAHADDYARIFSPYCDFDAQQLVARFAREYLALPLRRDEAALTAYLKEAPASITTIYQGDRSLTLQVRGALRAALPKNRTLPDLARAMFVSPRTLHRHLEEEGTSFRTIRDGLRRELAIEWLTKSDIPLQQIATGLGFSDAAAFYRAFSTWTGEGPRSYRQRTRQ